MKQARFKRLTAAFIRYAGRHPGFTQAALGDKLGVSQSLISKWIRGKQDIPLDMIPLLANALNCTTDYLLGETDLPTVELDPRAAGEYTGLSEDAISVLHTFTAAPFALDYQNAITADFPTSSPEVAAEAKAALSALICMPEFRGALASVERCKEAYRQAGELTEDGYITDKARRAEYQSDYMRYRIIDTVSDCLKKLLQP